MEDERVGYGERIVEQLARDLSARFGRGFSRANVFQMRQFYLTYRAKVQTVSGLLGAGGIVQTLSGQFDVCAQHGRTLAGESPAVSRSQRAKRSATA